MRPSFDFAIQRLGNNLICAEIGVRAGHNAFDMLNTGKIARLILVDPYPDYHEDEEHFKRERQDSFQIEAIKRLSGFTDKTIWMFTDSEHSASFFPDGFFDYVYIDGVHNYDWVKKDIAAWYNKVKKNGILAGHDYINFKEGLRRAVDEFVKEKGLVLMVDKIDWMVVCK